MRTIRIEVTAEDIFTGKPGDPCECAVALAARRAFGVKECSVEDVNRSAQAIRMGLVLLPGETDPEKYALPDSAVDFIGRYDEGQDVEPFSFEVEVPDVA